MFRNQKLTSVMPMAFLVLSFLAIATSALRTRHVEAACFIPTNATCGEAASNCSGDCNYVYGGQYYRCDSKTVTQNSYRTVGPGEPGNVDFETWEPIPCNNYYFCDCFFVGYTQPSDGNPWGEQWVCDPLYTSEDTSAVSGTLGWEATPRGDTCPQPGGL